MKKYILLILTFVSSFANAQSPARDYTNAVLWQQTSGEYRALCFQAYNFARLSLKEALWADTSKKPNCIIVDIDETVLDNSPFQGHEIKKGLSYDAADWTQWTSLARADTVPGALAFLKFAAAKNIETFYLSNRDEKDYAATLKNLQAFGFPYANDAHLLVAKGTSNKEPRRQKIAETHNILMLCGDNLSDFSNIFYRENKNTFEQVNENQNLFGIKYIVLPNPMYGDWEKPLYQGEKPSDQEKAKQRLGRLKSY
ncbi:MULTISPECIES: 5'-nucleotidase, lipoprotein e(P4) family [unclassified Pedobacter]|jgi:5'-nucleotidase (lipoprotein e(P4) family)|uniref:5'-nucleotidase, lipoprotein e(P4) family n=1 Tax=unclassified Pedobacter TaxID=2628915 RepID=UPI000B4BAA3E|nr:MULTISPECIES: 5'-nucleotidase, lipoprotein e(P4) family [unclassified Pedobacter]MCX2586023.1 5'-nucleotidase, lipoprotein e(P4) family [Pedobacter sp. MR22-3]OWK72261.1 5'-nucleotidase, lipoprotein e(P4) family [Pedobacter sp. AJM]